MCTLVCEGIRAFYSSKGLISLPQYRVLFLIGIPLSSTKCGWQDISLYMQSQIASKLLSGPSAYPAPFSFIGVSLLMASAFWCDLPTPLTTPIRSSLVDNHQWKLIVVPTTVNLCLNMSKHYFYLYQVALILITT